MTTEIMIPEEQFQDLRVIINGIKETNESMIFNYEDPTDNKAARQHIHKLRLKRKPISDRVKKLTADAKAFVANVARIGKELDGEVLTMIDFHYKPIREIEEREAEVAAAKLAEEKKLEDWDEAIKDNEFLNMKLQIAKQDAELKFAQEAKLEVERIETERVENERIQAEFDAIQAVKDAEQKKIDDAQRIKEEVERIEAKREAAKLEKIATEKAEDAAREADIEHKRVINCAILDRLETIPINRDSGMNLITAILRCEIPNLTIKY